MFHLQKKKYNYISLFRVDADPGFQVRGRT